MNVYDFDKTIYRGDCTLDFWHYCIYRNPYVLKALPSAAIAGIVYKCGAYSKEQFKERFYYFLNYISNIEEIITHFWDQHFLKVDGWYLKQRQNTDLIISASPEFLISEICSRLHVRFIASKVDLHTGKLKGKNCFGNEKVKMLMAEYPKETIECFYSDSKTDEPLAKIAEHAYLVKKGYITNWYHDNGWN